MSNQAIPDAAVEAAAKAFIEHGTLLPALEAAAPHMLAGVADSREGDLFRFTWAQREWLRGGAK